MTGNLSALARRFDALAAALPRELARASNQAAIAIRDQAAAQTPRRTGTLLASLGVTLSQPDDQPIVVGVGFTAPYAAAVELGVKAHLGRHMLGRAVERQQATLQQRMQDAVAQAVRVAGWQDSD